MKRKAIIFFLNFLCFVPSLFALPDEMAITVEGKDDIFVKRTFTNGTVFFTNRTYTLENIPTSFDGYEFLASAGKSVDTCVIIPSMNGLIYMIAPSGGLNGWVVVEASEFSYSDGNHTKLSIYQKAVVLGDSIDIPLVSSFPGTSPLAKTIEYKTLHTEKDASLSMIKVDDLDLENFSVKVPDYKFYLPYNYDKIPVVLPLPNQSKATYSIVPAVNIHGSESERTTTITVKSEDNSVTQTSKVTFEVLPELDLFLCIGQSNMSGRAPMDATKGDYELISHAYLMTTARQFVGATNPMNIYSNVEAASSLQKVSPSYSFAKEIASKTNKTIGLIVNAKGGTNIESWEKSGTDTLYGRTMVRALEAKKWGTYKAILWHQGEFNRNGVAAYPQQLQELVTDLRTDLGNNELLFVAGEIGYWRSDVSDFNNMIRTISGFIGNSAYASAEGLTNIDLTDAFHFDRESQLILGERYASIVLDKIYGITGISPQTKSGGSDIYSAGNKLKISTSGKALCKVTNIMGRLLYEAAIDETLEMELQSGLYIVSIDYPNRQIHQKVIIK